MNDILLACLQIARILMPGLVLLEHWLLHKVLGGNTAFISAGTAPTLMLISKMRKSQRDSVPKIV